MESNIITVSRMRAFNSKTKLADVTLFGMSTPCLE
jgi:hypothetical protein